MHIEDKATELEAENTRLRRQVKDLEMDKEILKKAAVYSESRSNIIFKRIMVDKEILNAYYLLSSEF